MSLVDRTDIGLCAGLFNPKNLNHMKKAFYPGCYYT
jgi:hypothetical protein